MSSNSPALLLITYSSRIMCGMRRSARSEGGLGTPRNEENRSRAKMFSCSLSSNSMYSVEWDLSPLPKSFSICQIEVSSITLFYLGPRLNAPTDSNRSMTARTAMMAMNPIVSGLAEPDITMMYQIIAANTVIHRKNAGIRVTQHFCPPRRMFVENTHAAIKATAASRNVLPISRKM